MTYPAPVIVVPGITASQLRDEYVLPPDIVWSAVLNKEYERVALHPDNVRLEALEPARVMPDYIFEVAYKELVNELRHNLSEQADKPVPVFPFSYDWRQPLEMIEAQLAAFVEEVIERTKLLRHYYEDGYAANPKVNLVGHSMGGLVITGYLERYAGNSRAAKVVTLATPFRGSFEAVIKISTGTANLGTSAPSSREREVARLMPALYQLLPSCGGIVADPGLPTSIFDPGLWQPSVLQTLKEYVRLHSVQHGDIDKQANDLFSKLLNQAKTHRDRIDSLRLPVVGLTANDWLCVVGVNSITRVRLTVKNTSQGPDFAFNSADREDLWGEGHTQEERHQTGDGTVPFDGALPEFLALENIICVTPDDFGYWEVQDRVFSAIAGFHGILPNMDMLHRLIVRHFTGSDDPRGNTWGRPAPGVPDDKWQPPFSLRRK
jgi:pimeloyl-ACP methyl ester carboxylesterase